MIDPDDRLPGQNGAPDEEPTPPHAGSHESIQDRLLDENTRDALAPSEANAAQLAAIYEDLKRIAVIQMRKQPHEHTLQATALVNEAYLKLLGRDDLDVSNSRALLELLSRVMRQVLVDHARAKRTNKRGGGWHRITLSGATPASSAFHVVDILALEEALVELTAMSPDNARLVELRFFGGLHEDQAAEVLGISRREASRRWRLVRAWLSGKLREVDSP
ncbi:MAG: ECF-type sigma factor [Phycisphaerae bacterium]